MESASGNQDQGSSIRYNTLIFLIITNVFYVLFIDNIKYRQSFRVRKVKPMCKCLKPAFFLVASRGPTILVAKKKSDHMQVYEEISIILPYIPFRAKHTGDALGRGYLVIDKLLPQRVLRFSVRSKKGILPSPTLWSKYSRVTSV